MASDRGSPIEAPPSDLPDLNLGDYLHDPVATLASLRESGDVARAGDQYMVLRHRLARELLTDPNAATDFTMTPRLAGVDGPIADWFARIPGQIGGETHERWRKFLTPRFTRARIDPLRPYLADQAHILIDSFAPSGSCEFMSAFANRYPATGLWALLGLPDDDRDELVEWANGLGRATNPIELTLYREVCEDALEHLLAFAHALLDERRERPRDDLATDLALAGPDDGFEGEVAADTIVGVILGGHETTKNQLGLMLAEMGDRPELWERLGQEPELIPRVVAELLRLRPAVPGLIRCAAGPIELDDLEIPAGAAVNVSIASANRDEQAWPCPADIDLEADQTEAHLTFSHGPYHCLGGRLAEIELEESLRALVARIGPPVVVDATFRPPVGRAGPEELHLRFEER